MLMTPHTLAATLALFDGDADEATVVARIVALRQDPDWRVALHNGFSVIFGANECSAQLGQQRP